MQGATSPQLPLSTLVLDKLPPVFASSSSSINSEAGPQLLPPAPPTSLLGRLRGVSSRQRMFFLLVLAVMCLYSFALLINGASGRLISVTPRIDTSGFSEVGLATYLTLDPIFFISLYRVLGCVLICCVMLWRGDFPAREDRDIVSSALLIPVGIGFCNAGGYFLFSA